MAKKAQLTIFMIIGIIIIVIFAFLFIAIQQDNKVREILSPEKNNPVAQFVQSCLEYSADESIKELMRNGGHKAGLAYDVIPSESDMQNSLSKMVNTRILSCVDDYSALINQGYSVTAKIPKTKVSINPDDVLFVLEFKITARKDNSEISEDKFRYSAENIRIPYVRQLAESILISDEWINANELLKELESNFLKLKVMAGQEKILYSIESGSFRFNFGQIV